MSLDAKEKPPRDLAAFHATRAETWRLFADLLATRETAARLAGTRAKVGGPLALALEGTTREALLRERETALARDRCEGPKICCRALAFKTVDVSPDATRACELGALALLAEATARALRGGDFPHAARLCEVQGCFLREHAAPCLARLAADLEASGTTVHALAGAALSQAIERDLRLVGSPCPLAARTRAGSGGPCSTHST